jgi:hypothetical protein
VLLGVKIEIILGKVYLHFLGPWNILGVLECFTICKIIETSECGKPVNCLVGVKYSMSPQV